MTPEHRASDVPITSTATSVSAVNLRVVSTAFVLFVAGSVYLSRLVHWRHGALFLVGGVLGLFLYHAAFGFTSSWRVFISDRRGAGLRGQMLLLAIACVLFFPVLASGTPLLTDSIRGNVNPLGTSVVVGAFLFGVGMQFGGGCASGTLFTVGGGNTRMLVTLAGFHRRFGSWRGPRTVVAVLAGTGGSVTRPVVRALGCPWDQPGPLRRDRARDSRPRTPTSWPTSRVSPATSAWLGSLGSCGVPWPYVAGAAGLALANFATLALAGRPWGITSGFALWGSKAAATVGFDPGSWTYWSSPARQASLTGSVFTDTTSVMNFGILLGR